MLWIVLAVIQALYPSDIHPLVRTMLVSNGEPDSPYFEALAELAREQGLDPKDYIHYERRNAWSRYLRGRAIRLDGHVLLIQEAMSPGIPGTEAQQLILLDRRGRILDKIACGINSRYGELETVVSDTPEGDGARLVIRFVPRSTNRSAWHNWHTITHHGRDSTYREEDRERPTEWDREGLCRIAIRDGRFVVVFPQPGKAER